MRLIIHLCDKYGLLKSSFRMDGKKKKMCKSKKMCKPKKMSNETNDKVKCQRESHIIWKI